MKIVTDCIDINTKKAPEFIDITEQVCEFVEQSKVTNGIVLVFSKHTTAGIIIQENEPLLLQDFSTLLNTIAPKTKEYNHNNFSIRTVHMHEDECPNGHSHCQHILIGTSETIPVINNSLTLGKWQRIFLVELDADYNNDREIIVQLIGN